METSRRDVLRVGAAASGALVLELLLPGCGTAPQQRMINIARTTGLFAPNAWLTITPKNEVVLTLDRVEMGQGTMTSHAQLLAEELEVAVEAVHVVFAGAHRAYDNPDPELGIQITGGSSSVRTSYEPLRRAGASAREMLRYAAAERWDVSIEECSAREGAVVHAPTRRSLSYGELCRDAARQPLIEPRLKPPSEFRVIGKSVPRKDARAKVTGAARFGIDVTMPDLLTAIVVRPPRLGAKLLSFDAAAARRAAGIVDVVAIEAGVAIVATRYYHARAAESLVSTSWSPGDRASSEAMRREYRERLNHVAEAVRTEGKPATHSDLESIYEVPFLHHATMEPMNATARFADGKIEVWAPTQSPGLAREEVKRVTGLSYEAITIHQTFLGGGFGRRIAQDYVGEAAALAMKIGRPVKIIWSREDDMTHGFHRPMTMNVLRATVSPKGEITSWFHRAVSQSIIEQVGREFVRAVAPNGTPDFLKAFAGRSAVGLYASSTLHDGTTTEGASDFAYDIPNLRVEFARAPSKIPVGFWRSVGLSENTFVVESFLDEIAWRTKQDPVVLRRTLLSKSPRLRAVLDLCAKEAAWNGPRSDGKFRGVAAGIAFKSYCAQVADVSVENGKWRVERVVCAIDCGTVVNPDLVRAQVEGAIIFGLSALRQQITFAEGAVVQKNFNDYPLLRMHEAPRIEVHIMPSTEAPTGVGEVGLPAIAPAVTNAIFAATGVRVRELPIRIPLA